MTLQSFKGGMYFPDPVLGHFAWLDRDTSTLSIAAVGAKAGMLFEAPFTGNIDRVFAYIGAHTTTGTLDVRLETIDAATGLPSGTLVATTTNGAFITSGTGVIDVTLTAVAPVIKGTQYALVIVQAAGSCVISAVKMANTGISASLSGGGIRHRRAHCALFSAGAWSTRSSANTYGLSPQCAFHYDNGNYYTNKGVYPFSTIAGTTFNNTSTTRERGMAFSLPFPSSATGFFLTGDLTLTDVNVVLADTSGTALLTASLDKDFWTSYASGTNYGGAYVGYFSTSQTLAANTTYYLTVVPQSASNAMLREFTLISGSSIAAQMDAMTGGQSCILVTRASGGAYTTTASQRPQGFGVILDQFDDAAGGGSASMIMSRLQAGM